MTIADQPADWLFVTADQLDEAGQSDLAFAYRWMASRGKRPKHRLVSARGFNVGPRYGWGWYTLRSRVNGEDVPPEARLPRCVFQALPNTPAYKDHRYYDSDQTAVAALAAALQFLRELVAVRLTEPRAVDPLPLFPVALPGELINAVRG